MVAESGNTSTYNMMPLLGAKRRCQCEKAVKKNVQIIMPLLA